MSQGEIIIYQASDTTNIQLEVRVEQETVWLNRQQISKLFGRDVKTIGKHIANALNEELSSVSVVANFATTATDNKIYQVEHYNLDMIISIGYRVKSERGIKFRCWANSVLKEYLLRGYAVHQRIETIENDVTFLKEKAKAFDLHIRTSLPPHEGIFFDGQIFDAHVFVSDIIKSAKESIVLIDNYIDESVLVLISKRKVDVAAKIYTHSLTPQFQLDLKKHNEQYPPIEVKTFKKSHDRFLIIDKTDVLHVGASLKDLGKKWFAFSKIQLNATEMIAKLEGGN